MEKGSKTVHPYSPLISQGADTPGVGEGGAAAIFFLASAGVVEWPGGARWLTDGGPVERRRGGGNADSSTVGARPSQGSNTSGLRLDLAILFDAFLLCCSDEM